MSGNDARVLRPRCPNHDEPLEVTAKELMAGKGHAPCPVSGYDFEWQCDPATVFVDKFGQKFIRVKISGNEN